MIRAAPFICAGIDSGALCEGGANRCGRAGNLDELRQLKIFANEVDGAQRPVSAHSYALLHRPDLCDISAIASAARNDKGES